MSNNEVTRSELHAIVNNFLDQGWSNLELKWNDYELQLRKVTALPATAPQQAPAATPALATPGAGIEAAPIEGSAFPTTAETGTVIAAPMMGTFYSSPSPGAAPFVGVGAEVTVGQSLCIVEVMKLMTRVDSDVAGIITEIHAENGQLILEGDPLFTVSVPS